MPKIPQPFKIINWETVAREYDRRVFDYDAQGELLPLIWTDPTHKNFDRDGFGLYSYAGDPRQGPDSVSPDAHEGITALGSVLGASLVGIDKRCQHGRDFVTMCQNYFNLANGMRIVTNDTRLDDNYSFWYDLYPNILFFCLTDLYPLVKGMSDIMRMASDRLYKAVQELNGDYRHTAFDFKAMRPYDNGMWAEPHAAAGFAWLQYAAYRRFNTSRFLRGADSAMRALHGEERTPNYELLLPWGATTAARMNAELGRRYDVHKILNWCFSETSDARRGWGVISDRWGGYDVHGLAGSTIDFGGYAFALNTFNLAMPLIPLVRYDPRYAHDIGKWFLNAANAARLFYPNELPAENQTCAEYARETGGMIAYEGLAKERNGRSPLAMGGALRHGWGKCDFSLYGSSLAGVFGGLIDRTNHEEIPQLDCLKTDFFRDDAYPTYLYYNPYPRSRTVLTDVGPDHVDLYDLVSRKILRSSAGGQTSFELRGDTAAVIVLCPTDGVWTRDDGRLLVDDVIVDFGIGVDG